MRVIAKKSPSEQARAIADLWDDHGAHFEDHWAKIRRFRNFTFKGEQYDPKDLVELRRNGRIAPITEDTFDLVRFEAADISSQPLYLSVRPEVPESLVTPEPQFDSATGQLAPPEQKPERDPKWAQFALEHDFYSEDGAWAEACDLAVLEGIGNRAGCFVMDWDPSQGRRGRIVPYGWAAEDVLWHSSYRYLHAPGNPFVSLRGRFPLAWAKAMYPKVADYLKADDGWPDLVEPFASKVERITLMRTFRLYDWSNKLVFEPSHTLAQMPAQARYLACLSCGWESGAQGSNSFPRETQCPECGQTAQRIDVSGELKPTAAYLKGKQFTVCAPYSPSAGLLDERGWPGDPRNFPVAYYVPNPSGRDPSGLCDPEWNSDIQCAKNAGMARMVEAMDQNRDMAFAVAANYTTASGEPYGFNAGSDYWGFVNGDSIPEALEMLQGIKQVKGSGLPNGSMEYLDWLTGQMRSTRGTEQFGATPQELKGTPVGTLERYLQSGSVPGKMKLARWWRVLEVTLQNLHDMQRNLWSSADWVSIIGPNGLRAHRAMKGSDIPPARIRVNAKPEINPAKLDAFDKFRQVLGDPNLQGKALDIAFQVLEVPEEWAQQIREERAAQPPPNPAAAGPGGAGVGAGMPAPQPMQPVAA